MPCASDTGRGLPAAGQGYRGHMAYYYNHNLAYDFAVFEEQKKAPAAHAKRSEGDRSAGSADRVKVNRAPARRAPSGRTAAQHRAASGRKPPSSGSRASSGRRASSDRRAPSGRRAISERRASAARGRSFGRKPKVKREKRRKTNFARIALGVVFGLAAVVMIASIIHGQVQLTEINQEIINARAELAEKQSIYTQLEMKVDSSISTSAVEKYAQETLHMSKATNSQKEFIFLSEGDKAEVVLSENKSIFRRLWDAISSLWS